jgi:hypothetical protein
VVEAKAMVAGVTVETRSTAPVPNAIIAILRVFIVTLRKESVMDPLEASFHDSTDPSRRHVLRH